MDPQELLLIAFRALVVYLVLLLIVRLLGKREVGNFGAFDLIVALILGEVVDEAIYGDVSMAKFAVAVAVVALLHLGNSWLSFKSKAISKLTEAEPDVMVEDGKICQEALAKERMTEDDLYSLLRLQSVDKGELNEVKKATLEPDGGLSVIKHDWAKPVQKSDLPEEKAKAAKEA